MPDINCSLAHSVYSESLLDSKLNYVAKTLGDSNVANERLMWLTRHLICADEAQVAPTKAHLAARDALHDSQSDSR